MNWTDAVLLKIHLGTTDHIEGESASTWLIQAARRSGLRGATVSQGSIGFGPDGELQRAALFHFAQNLPVIVEIVDEGAKLERFLDEVSVVLPPSALLTAQPIRSLTRLEASHEH